MARRPRAESGQRGSLAPHSEQPNVQEDRRTCMLQERASMCGHSACAKRMRTASTLPSPIFLVPSFGDCHPLHVWVGHFSSREAQFLFANRTD